MTQIDKERADAIEAEAFRRLLAHLRTRSDVQNITLMIHGGFCRNCLADWLRDAAAEAGLALSRDEAREHVYGQPYAQWKAAHGRDATPEEEAAFRAARPHHG